MSANDPALPSVQRSKPRSRPSSADTAGSFGDADPEDSWDPDDPLAELVDNLRRRVVLLIALVVLTDRDRLRIRMLGDDLAHLLARVLDEIGEG